MPSPNLWQVHYIVLYNVHTVFEAKYIEMNFDDLRHEMYAVVSTILSIFVTTISQ